MRSIINKTPWILAVLILLQYSCSEDWLKPEPLSFYSSENIFIDEAGFQSLLVAMRRDIKNDSYYGYNDNFINQYTISDLGVAGPLNPLTCKDNIRQFIPAGDGGQQKYYRLYEESYKAIKTTNILVSRIDRIIWKDVTKRNEILAEAFFFRSYWYYRLIHAYGDVSFTGSEITSAKLDFYTYSRWAILKKLIADMEFAVQWLPVKAIPGAASRGAGDHLLTKLYLANSDFDKAIESATRVISGPYALMKNRFGSYATNLKYNVIWDLNRPENISISQNTETLLAVIDRYEAPSNAKSGGSRKPFGFACKWYNPEIKDSKGLNGTISERDFKNDTMCFGNAMCRITPFFIYEIWADGTYHWKNTTDLRRSDICWVNKEELRYNRKTSVDYLKPINPNYFASQNDTFQFYFSYPQYKIFYPVQDPTRTAWSATGNGDSYVFRLAETYLLRAEAYFWKGDLSNAAKDINEVRDRAKAKAVLSADVTIDYIMDERARELFPEEPRQNELTRISYIMAKNNIGGYSLENFSEHNYFYDRVIRTNVFYRTNFYWGGANYTVGAWHVLWPIPATIITANTMGVINQNQGYSGTENNITPLETIEE